MRYIHLDSAYRRGLLDALEESRKYSHHLKDYDPIYLFMALPLTQLVIENARERNPGERIHFPVKVEAIKTGDNNLYCVEYRMHRRLTETISDLKGSEVLIWGTSNEVSQALDQLIHNRR